MREHRHQDDDPRRDRSGARAATPRVEAPADAVLALQRGAGNRAVAGVLARDPKEQAPEKTATSVTSQLGDLGIVPLDSVSWDANGKEVHIVFGGGEIVTRFMQAFAQGRPLDPAWISTPAAKSTLTGALVSQAQLSTAGGGEQLVNATLNFEKVAHDFVRH